MDFTNEPITDNMFVSDEEDDEQVSINSVAPGDANTESEEENDVDETKWELKKQFHNKVTMCSLCEKVFQNTKDLQDHVKQVHLTETYKCSICHEECTDLYIHMKYFHKKKGDFHCSYCEKKFHFKNLLYIHVQKIHLGEKTNCPDCKKDISIDNFKRHVREIHKKIKKSHAHIVRMIMP